MSITRFFARTTSEALRKVRDALGPEGVILSNRPMEGGIEILALHQDDIPALIPTPTPQDAEAERFEGRRLFLSHVLSSKQAKANERKANPGEPGYEAHAFATASPKDLVNHRKKTGMADNGLHSSGNPSGSGAERKRKPEHEIRMDLGQDPAGTDAVDAAATEQKDRNRAINAVEIKTKGSVTRKPRSKQNSHQTAGSKADPMANRMANHMANHQADRIADQLERPAETGVARHSRRLSDTGRTAAEKPLNATTATSKRKPKQMPVIDTRQLAAEVTSSVLKEIKSMRSALEQQFSSLNWNGNESGGSTGEHLLRHLLAAGFSVPLANGLMEQLPYSRGEDSEEDAMKVIKTSLIRNLKTMSGEDEILEKGGIYALVGPTGV